MRLVQQQQVKCTVVVVWLRNSDSRLGDLLTAIHLVVFSFLEEQQEQNKQQQAAFPLPLFGRTPLGSVCAALGGAARSSEL